MSMILHFTLTNIVADSFPQKLLVAMHLYSPLSFLLILMIVSSFPLGTGPVLTFFQKKVRGWVPVATLHSCVTFSLSTTVTFRSCFIVGASVRNTFKWEILCFYWLTCNYNVYFCNLACKPRQKNVRIHHWTERFKRLKLFTPWHLFVQMCRCNYFDIDFMTSLKMRFYSAQMHH